VVEVEPLVYPGEGDGMLRPSVSGGWTCSRHQYLTIVELLLTLAFLRPVSAEDDIDFSVDAREGSTSSLLLLLGLSWFSWSSSWRGRR
jgi:acyl dehydratase